MSASAPPRATSPDDPVFLSSLREMWILLGVWLVCLVWVVSYCYIDGYQPVERPEDLHTVLGMPRWVMWGVAVPWVVADIVTIVFCTCVMKDESLEPAHPVSSNS